MSLRITAVIRTFSGVRKKMRTIFSLNSSPIPLSLHYRVAYTLSAFTCQPCTKHSYHFCHRRAYKREQLHSCCFACLLFFQFFRPFFRAFFLLFYSALPFIKTVFSLIQKFFARDWYMKRVAATFAKRDTPTLMNYSMLMQITLRFTQAAAAAAALLTTPNS